MAARHLTPAARGPRSGSNRRHTAPWMDRSELAAAELIVVEGPHVGRRHSIFGGEVIGRDDDVDIQIDADEVSRRHCRVMRTGAALLRVGAALQIEDLGSRNGTWIRGERLFEPRALAFGERITLGTVVLLVARPPAHDEQDDPLERFDAICQLVGDAASQLDAALMTTLAAIDELRGASTNATLADPAVRGSVGDLIGSVHHQLEFTRQLRELGRVEPNRDARIVLGQVCHTVARALAPQHGERVEMKVECTRVEVKGDLVELHQLLRGAAERLLELAPDGGTLELTCRTEAVSPADARHRLATVELRRRGTSAVVPANRLELSSPHQRHATLHGGRIDPLPDAIGFRLQLPAMGRSRGGATRDAAASLVAKD
jgi:hypothetical protein